MAMEFDSKLFGVIFILDEAFSFQSKLMRILLAGPKARFLHGVRFPEYRRLLSSLLAAWRVPLPKAHTAILL
jgi:hypothetical protein